MARIFAYIVHKGGVADDSAAELLAAAEEDRSCCISHGDCDWFRRGPRCRLQQPRASYSEVWKIANEALAYPNAELVRQALVKVVPRGSIVLVPHDHFGIDLGAGAFHQAERGVCLRRGGHRWRGRS